MSDDEDEDKSRSNNRMKEFVGGKTDDEDDDDDQDDHALSEGPSGGMEDHEEEEDDEDDDDDDNDDEDDDNDDEDNVNEDDNEDNDDNDDPDDDDEDGEDDQDGKDEEEDNDSGSQQDSSDENESSDDNDDDDDDDDDGKNDSKLKDGLSDYERLRLERIKRNEERLAKLGLQSKDGGGILGKKPKKKRIKKPENQVPIKKRERLSRSTKEKKVDYAKDFNFRAILPNGGRIPPAKKSNPPSKNSFENRVPLFIYKELQRIKAKRKENLKHAKRASKQAEKELKHWKRQVEVVIRRDRHKHEKQLTVSRLQHEREILGGKTRREILNEIDQRGHELTRLVNAYDTDQSMVTEFKNEQQKKLAMERKMQMVDSLDRFPRAVNEALSTLNALLVGRSPKDPPPPRRSKRSSDEVEPPPAPKSSSKKRIKISLAGGLATAVDTGETEDAGAAWANFASSIANNAAEESKPPPAPKSESKAASLAASGKKEKQRKLKDPKNVGGWISPLFSQVLDRSWLEREKPLKPIPPPPAVPKSSINKVFDLKSYVPQVGDVVLYYPSAHRAFLQVHPDLLNKQLKNQLRYPLWIRGKREQNRLKLGKETMDDFPNIWWTDDWVNDLNDNYGKAKTGPSVSDYPILCQVDRVHTEFPVDPYADQKKVTKTNEGTVIDYAGDNKNFTAASTSTSRGSKKKVQNRPQIHLCALLTPLTPILPPGVVADDPYTNVRESAEDADTDGRAKRSQPPLEMPKFSTSTTGLSLPPKLTVTIFPSSSSSAPFVVPFNWAYAMHHTLSIDEPIWSRGNKATSGGKGKVIGFKNSGFKAEAEKEDRHGKNEASAQQSISNGALSPSFRIEENFDAVEGVLARLNAKESVLQAIEEELALSTPRLEIPVREVCILLDFLTKLVAERKASVTASIAKRDMQSKMTDAPETMSLSLVDLIQRTLPSRNSIAVSFESNHRQTHWFSPWKIFSLEPTDLMRSFRDGALPTLDPVLRDKAEMCIEDFLQANEYASVFVPQVNEEAAPSYYLAVPVGMHFGRIKARLKADSQGRCYYTSIESIQSDLQAITDNCSLYNAPDSEIALLSANYVHQCKRMMSDIISQHARSHQKTEMKSIKSSASNPSSTATGKKPQIPYDLNVPFKGSLNREWLGRILPDGATLTPDPKEKAENAVLDTWVPQCGDCILYSRSRHLEFVMRHESSLSSQQKVVPTIEVDEDEKETDADGKEADGDESNRKALKQNASFLADNSDGDAADKPLPDDIESSWLEGMIVSVRATFPRAPDGRDSFGTITPILAIELSLRYAWIKDTILVCWRPSPDVDSFLQPCWLAERADPILLADIPTSEVSAKVSDKTLALIGQCFDFLKDRVMNGVAPETVSPEEVLWNAESGIVGKPTTQNLPSYGSLLSTDADTSKKLKAARPKKAKDELAEKELLAAVNYLPLWTVSGRNNGIEGKSGKGSREGPKKQLPMHETTLPVPTLCLELVRLRVMAGYYRHALSVVSDTSESYVTSVLFLLHGPATRKKDPLSIRKISKFLASPQGHDKLPKYSRRKQAFGKKFYSGPAVDATIGEGAPNGKSKAPETDPMDDFSDEERQLVAQIRGIRMLHAVAIACATDTTKVQRLFFLLPKDVVDPTDESASEPEPTELAIPDAPSRTPEEINAIQTIRYLLYAIQRDKMENKFKFRKTGMFKLRIKCDRKTIVTTNGFVEELPEPGRFMFEPSSTIARIKKPEKYVRVHIMVGSEAIYGPRTANMTATKFILPKGAEGKKHIELDHEAFKENDNLTTTFFAQEGRRAPCVRCQANGRGLFRCRVMKGHSNLDFAFDEHFKGSGGLNKSLLLPWTKHMPNEAEVGEAKEADEGNEAETDGGDGQDDEKEDKEPHIQSEESWEKRAEDARAHVGKAQRALQLSRYLLSQAQLMTEQEVRLSDEFIEDYFPTDDDDGHYVYCSICGLSGDVICCETCPVVMHPKCIGLKKIPDGDWFCPKCTASGKHKAESGEAPPASLSNESSAATKINPNDGKQTSNSDHGTESELILDEDEAAPAKHPGAKTEANKVSPTNEESSSKLKKAPAPELDEDDYDKKQDELDDLLEMLIDHREKTEGVAPKKTKSKSGSGGLGGRTKPGQAPKREREVRVHSNNPIENLPAMGRRFCAGIGVESAEDFLDRPSSELARQFVDWRAEVGERPLNGSGPSAYISMFKAQLRQEVELNKMKQEKQRKDQDKGAPGNTTVKLKRRRRAPDEDPWLAVAPDPRIKKALSSSSRSPSSSEKRQRNNVFSDGVTSGHSTGSAEERYLRAIKNGSDDPLENLPALGRKFLAWMGVTDADDFLSQRTSDLAVSFVKYRKHAKMSVLNGTGAAAYCGSWKSQVRKQLSLQEEMGVVDGSKKRKPKSSVVRDVETPSPAPKKAKKSSTPASSSKRTRFKDDDDDDGNDDVVEQGDNNNDGKHEAAAETKNIAKKQKEEEEETISGRGRRRISTQRLMY